MMGQLPGGQQRLFYSFNLEDHVPAQHLLRSIDQCLDLSDLRAYLADFYSPIGRLSIDPELMVRMLVVGYLLWHSFRAAIVRRGAPEPGLSLVLPVGSGRRSPQSLDLLEESPWAFS